MLATPADVRRYVDADDRELSLVLRRAEEWVEERVVLNGHVPPAVCEATALLAAVYRSDPLAMYSEADVPNMVRVMIIPWTG